MKPKISRIAEQLTGSAIVENRRKADLLEAKGISIVDFGVGEPDFQAPACAVEAAIKSIKSGQGNYIDPRGLPELRQEIAEMVTRRHSYPVSQENIVVTTGSYGALTIAARTLLDAGDQVLLPEPFWGPYRNIVQLTGAVPVSVPGNAVGAKFVVDPHALRAQITPQTRALVINSPNNPTGRVLAINELHEIAEIALENNLWIIADEVYSELVFESAKHISIASLSPEVAARCVVVSSLSKSFAMTGWRLGYCIAPPEVAQVIARINHYSVRCPTSFVQYAAVATLRGAWDDVERMRKAYLGRRNLVIERIRGLPGLSIDPPQGTFYAFPRIPESWGTGKSFAERLLNDEGVIVSAGGAYGKSASQHFRISFATSEKILSEGFDRIYRMTAKLCV